jgi:hypothetical protein
MQDVKLILGWKMDSHLLTIALGDEKYSCWTIDIYAMLKIVVVTFPYSIPPWGDLDMLVTSSQQSSVL